jgi:uncharacterized protein (DUF1501 family)
VKWLSSWPTAGGDLSRRDVLRALGVGGVALGLPGLSFAAAEGDARLLVVLLRGGLDGLGAVPPYGDPDYQSARGSMALAEPGTSDTGVVDLDGFFGLHPALAPLMPMWEAKELALVHATALPFKDRSHFDSQNVLENGTARPFGVDTGWLNRALVGRDRTPALAVGRALPLLLRGPAATTSADPLRSFVPDDSFLVAVSDLYRGDAELGDALDIGIQTQAMLATHRGDMRQASRERRPDLEKSARVLGGVLAAPDGPRVAVLEVGGWDTHTGQQGALTRLLGGFASAMEGLRDAMGPTWKKTVVLGLTEFGRTIHANGTAGTDHGTASVSFVLGGGVAGGRVYGEWPGLDGGQQHQGRDLRGTTDIRSLSKAVLMSHLGVSDTLIEDSVFPESREARPMLELMRT